jgi:molybdate transport repressor ModE-like protein
MKLMNSIQLVGSIAQAAREVGLSYRYAWGLLREGEVFFGHTLLEKGRGRGTNLTPLAKKLIWADRRVSARLSPLLESLSSELEHELAQALAQHARTIRLHASHGFAVAALLTQLNQAGLPVELSYRNSTDAVAALSRRECDLAGFQVPMGEFESIALAQYTPWLSPKAHCLIHLAVRQQGLFVLPGNPKNITNLHDLTLPGIRFVNRQVGSGTRKLLELMLQNSAIEVSDIHGFDSAEFTHSAVAAYIASDMADVGFGVKTAAQRFGLDFIPLMKERYFFALPLDAMDDPFIQQVIRTLQSASFRDVVEDLAGYDASDTGVIQSMSEAFTDLIR